MTFHLHLLLPEFLVAGAVLAVIATELLLPAGRRAPATALTAFVGLGAALVALFVLWGGRGERPGEAAVAMQVWSGAGEGRFLVTGWRSDAFSLFTRSLAAAGGLLLVLLSVPYVRRMDRGHGEFYGLLLIALLGVMLVSGVSDFLSLFICLELVTVPSYVLAALKRNTLASTEAGLKYLVVGALSSAVLLLGIAFTYGAVGSVSFDALGNAVRGDPSPLLGVGLVLVLVGVLFKVGGVPFHVWIPDVYQGAPSPVTAFLSTASKSAGMVLLLRVLEAAALPAGDRGVPFTALLSVIAAATLLFGVLGAMPQRNVKRLLAYSSIGHAGYLLMGAAALVASGGGDDSGVTAILFYLLAFFFTNLTAFAVVVLVGGATGTHEHPAWSGLSRRSPFLALAMALALLSLAGVPPLSGFFGKFLVLSAVLEQAPEHHGLYVLASLGALGVVVSLYFYLLWIREMYARDPDPAVAQDPIRVEGSARAVLWIGIAAMLGMGTFMGPFHEWAREAARAVGVLP
jgi:NADH-quinone oxidoreductase subunit N